MEITISKENVIELLTNYYKETEDFNGIIRIKTKKELTGHNLSESEVAKTKIERKEEINLLGVTVPVVSIISEEEVLGIFQNLLSAKGYTVNSIKLDQGISNEYHYNGDYKVAYCNGLKLEVTKQVKEYRK